MNLKKYIVVIPLALATATCLVWGEEKQSSDAVNASRTVEGVWRTIVTPVNCQTGVPLGAPPISGLFTFNEGGTMSEYGISAGQGQTPALRSPGHGVWERQHGWQDYSFKFVFLRYDANGAFIGSQKITASLELGASGDDFTTHSAVEIFDANGNLIGTGCATAVGTRFE